MTTFVEGTSTSTAARVFAGWVEQLGAAMDTGDPELIADQFIKDGYWRDILSFTWDYRTFAGRHEIVTGLRETISSTKPHNWRVAPGRQPPRLVKRLAKVVIEGHIDFDTDVGRGSAFARLLFDEAQPNESKLWILLTTLQELRGFEERIGNRRPTGTEYSMDFGGENWSDKRKKAQDYSDRQPEVLIVGAGQAGLCLAARLTQIGVDSLVVESNDRVGDNWRHRYHSLTLHNEVWANSLPYLPFPPNWPTFLPKDKLAGWLEAYAEFMELNVWTSTEFVGGEFDEGTRLWSVRLRRSDGVERSVHVPNLVLAIGGVNGQPHIPNLPGLCDFAGEVVHSSRFTSGKPYTGKHAIVIGTGNSGHDMAQDLHTSGADVTMIQRSPTCVVSLVPSGTMVYELYSTGPIEDIDLITAAIPYEVLKETYQWLTKKMIEFDRELLARLERVGFKTDSGDDDTGFHMKYLRRGGGYYINVGCSDLIADGKIRLIQARDVLTLNPTGVTLVDGSTIDVDLVALATGYENTQEAVRRLLGDRVANAVGPVWGFNSQGFMRNMWTRTGQPAFWIMGGALNESRLYSRFLALLIKADLEGILPDGPIG